MYGLVVSVIVVCVNPVSATAAKATLVTPESASVGVEKVTVKSPPAPVL